MRLLAVVVSLVCFAATSPAFAKPKLKVAVAPIRGDTDGTIAEAVVDALAGKDFAVVSPDDVTRERKTRGLPADLGPRTVKKLAAALDVAAIVGGTTRTSGRKRTLHLDVHRSGKPDSGFTVEFKTTDAAMFHRGVHDQVLKRLGGTPAAADEPDPDDADKPVAQRNDDARSLADSDRKRRTADDDADRKRTSSDDADRKRSSSDDADRKRSAADNADRKRDSSDDADHKRTSSDDANRKRTSSDDADRKRSAANDADRKRDSDESGGRKRNASDDSDRKRSSSDEVGGKRKSSDEDADRTRSGRKRVAANDDDRRADDEPAVRKRKVRRGEAYAPGSALARAAAGASVAQRQLTYDTRSGFTQAPPRVRTTAGGARVDGEVYPFALADAANRLAGLGLAASYDKTFGLSIKIPNTAVSAPIDQSHYALGARYRLNVGSASTIKLGLDYLRRHYVADRDKLTAMALNLDAPDVDYSAIAPGISAHVPVTPTITAVAGADAMLMLATGPIQRTPSYGPATVYGIDALAGVDVAITPQIGVRVALEYSRISFSFDGKGQLTTTRDNDVTTQDVNGATDRWLGVAATVGLAY